MWIFQLLTRSPTHSSWTASNPALCVPVDLTAADVNLSHVWVDSLILLLRSDKLALPQGEHRVTGTKADCTSAALLSERGENTPFSRLTGSSPLAFFYVVVTETLVGFYATFYVWHRKRGQRITQAWPLFFLRSLLQFAFISLRENIFINLISLVIKPFKVHLFSCFLLSAAAHVLQNRGSLSTSCSVP